MERNRGREIALALLALVAVALVAGAAAPLFAQERDSGSPVYGMDPLNGSTGEFEVSGPIPVFELLGYAVFAIVAIAVVAQFVTEPWGALKKALAGAVIAMILVLVAWLRYNVFDPNPPKPNMSAPMNATPVNGSAGFGLGESDTPLVPTDSLAVVAIIAGGLGVVTLLAWHSGRLPSVLGLTGVNGEQDVDADLGALGQVAGRAADDVEDASTATAADNATYRAWSEMVALLDAPDPQ
jgi:hypothetical protein